MSYVRPNKAPCANGKIRGVNLGGWLLLERWITPSLYGKLDEKVKGDWGLCEALGKPACKAKLENHFKNWYTKKDFVDLYKSGINLIRIPVGYWSFVPMPDEPYVKGAAPYLTKALKWAEEIGLKVIIDLHGHAGSQNRFDNSGHEGPILWGNKTGTVENSLEFVKVVANDYVRKFPKVIHSYGIINEPANWGVNMTVLKDFYKKSYDMVQKIAPNTQIIFGDGFLPYSFWDDFMVDYPLAIVDAHIYHVFWDPKLNFTRTDHIDFTKSSGKNLKNSTYPMMVGEWSLATASCLKWVDGKCKKEDSKHPPTKDYNEFATSLFKSQHEQYENNSKGWIFWAAKTEDTPEWSYLTALKRKWTPDWSHCSGKKNNLISLPNYSLPAPATTYQRPSIS